MVHPATGQRDTGLERMEDASGTKEEGRLVQGRLAPSAGTMPPWPPRRWLGRCASGPGGVWLGQRQLLVPSEQVLNPPQGSPRGGLLATPTFVVFLRGFYWHLCLCIPHDPSCSRSLAHGAGGGPQHRPCRPSRSPPGPLHEHLVSAAVPRHCLTPCLGRTWHLPGDAAITDTHRDLWAKVPYTTRKPTTTTKKT